MDNYRKRNHHNPHALLENLWSELERRFGNAAVITNALIDRMHTTASFNENENKKLQEFVDLCEDVESQVAYLPGLACLNYPNAIQPIADKLPPPLRGKWEKKIAKYSDRNGGAYPSFSLFSQLVQNHARVKNDPNIHIGAKQPKQRPLNRRVLKSRTERDLKDPSVISKTRIHHDITRKKERSTVYFTTKSDITSRSAKPSQRKHFRRKQTAFPKPVSASSASQVITKLMFVNARSGAASVETTATYRCFIRRNCIQLKMTVKQ